MPSSGVERAARLRAWVPRWWRGEGGAAGRALDALLWPAERLYGAGVAARNRAFDAGLLPRASAPIPVVSVGNLAVGGAGKTPFSAWVAARYAAWGRRPALVLRGYGEDEVMVHRELNPDVPVYVAPRRVEGVERAAADGRDVAVLDDAFQHRALARDLDLVLVAAETAGLPRRRLPRGPWREPPDALGRADVLVVTRKSAARGDAEALAERLARHVPGRTAAVCRLAPTRLEPLHPGGTPTGLEWLRGRDVLAVASLADPGPLAAQLRALGARVELAAFADHHAFDAADARGILDRARGRDVVMTRKEAVKLRPLMPDGGARVLDQTVEIEIGTDALERALRAVVEP